jgi:xylan 1,4-beta-xylosidase
MQTLDIAGFIAACAAPGAPPCDFISTHLYPTDPQCQKGAGAEDPDCFAHTVLAAQKLAAAASKPFFITEYNDGLGTTSRDDSSAAAFVIRNVGLLSALDVWSWWTFSDVFEEGWMRSPPFHNGYGLCTVHGTRKPAWRAFEMLMGAGDKRLPVSGFVSPADGNATVSVLATRSAASEGLGLQLHVANFRRVGQVTHYRCDTNSSQCVVDPKGSYTDPSLCAAQCGKGRAFAAPRPPPLADCPARNVTLTLTHTAAEGAELPSEVDAYRIDDAHANPQAAWKAMGSPVYPTPAQLEALDLASKVTADSRVAVRRLSPTSSSLSFDMPPYSVLHLTL